MTHVDKGNTNVGDEKLMRTPRDTNVVASRKETTDVNQLKSELTNVDLCKIRATNVNQRTTHLDLPASNLV